MAHSLTRIGVTLECAIQAEMVVELELALIERKESRRFWHKSIICKKATKGFESAPRSKKTSKFGAIPTIIYKVTAFSKIVAHHFSLIGHLESVGRTEPVFELNLENRPTNE